MFRLFRSSGRFKPSECFWLRSVGNSRREFSISVSVDKDGHGVTLFDSDKKESKYASSLWLQERSIDPRKVHLESKQRLFEASDYIDISTRSLKDDAKIIEATIIPVDGCTDSLMVKYGDGSIETLNAHSISSELYDNYVMATDVGNLKMTPMSLAFPKPHLWGSDLSGKFQIDTMATHHYSDIAANERELSGFLHSLFKYGCAIVKGVPEDKGEYKKFINSFGILRETNWGKWFQVMAGKPNEKSEKESHADVANTSLAIPLHTDGPYNRNPLQHQVLHCIKQSSKGGESDLSDGLATVKYLEKNHPKEYKLLCETMVRFRYYDDNVDMFQERPIISIDGSRNEIFFSGRLDAPPAFDTYQQAEDFYYAKKLFLEQANSTERKITFKLDEGDMLIFDNCRLLHGRGEFQSVESSSSNSAENKTKVCSKHHTVDGVQLNSVSRYLRGCYLDSIDIRYRKLMNQKQHSTLTSARSFATSASSDVSPITKLDDCTKKQMEVVTELYSGATTGEKLADRSMTLLKMLGSGSLDSPFLVHDAHLGMGVDLLEHGLQTATRCYRDGLDEDIVVGALLHDVGELLSPTNHGEVAASLLRPYVTPKVSWMLQHHEVFQMYYYNEMMVPPGDKNVRTAYKNVENGKHTCAGVLVPKESYQFTIEFCEKYDQVSFDPNYSSMDIEEFAPLLTRVFSRKPYWHTPNHPKKGAVTGMK